MFEPQPGPNLCQVADEVVDVRLKCPDSADLHFALLFYSKNYFLDEQSHSVCENTINTKCQFLCEVLNAMSPHLFGSRSLPSQSVAQTFSWLVSWRTKIEKMPTWRH